MHKSIVMALLLVAAVTLACGSTGRTPPTLVPTRPAAAAPTATAEPTEAKPTSTAIPVIPSATAPATSTVAATDLAAFDRKKLWTVERDVTYCTVQGTALKMDVYYPARLDAPAPVVVYVHGGGWTAGNKDEAIGLGGFAALNLAGFIVASLEYRLAPQYQFPAQIEDVKCAIRYLRASATDYNLDSHRIGAWGSSAGGHLVALLGLADDMVDWDVGQHLKQSSQVQAVVDMFGPTDLTQAFPAGDARIALEVFGITAQDDPRLAAASPVTYVSAGDPPFLILHGEDDRLVPSVQSRRLYDRLVAAGVPAELVMVKNAGHAFVPSGGPISPTPFEIELKIISFFEQQLR